MEKNKDSKMMRRRKQDIVERKGRQRKRRRMVGRRGWCQRMEKENLINKGTRLLDGRMDETGRVKSHVQCHCGEEMDESGCLMETVNVSCSCRL